MDLDVEALDVADCAELAFDGTERNLTIHALDLAEPSPDRRCASMCEFAADRSELRLQSEGGIAARLRGRELEIDLGKERLEIRL